MTEEKYKPKHLVLDEKGNELFNLALKKSGASSSKQAIRAIFEKYIENDELKDLTDFHNPNDITEIEALKLVKCDKTNCNLNFNLTKINDELNEVNENLIKINSELNDNLKRVKNELSNADLSLKMSPLQKIALEIVAENESKKRGKTISPCEVLIAMFTDYVFRNLIHFFEKPNTQQVKTIYEKQKKNI